MAVYTNNTRVAHTAYRMAAHLHEQPRKMRTLSRNVDVDFFIHGGEGGIRTPDTGKPHTRFRVVRLQPLGHLSNISIISNLAKN